MKKSLLFVMINLCLLQKMIAQSKGVDCLRANAITEGQQFKDKRYFKFFGILHQDTCTSFNRFTNYFYSSTDLKNNLPEKYCRAVVIDTMQAIKAEQAIKNLKADLYHCVRLYAGFIDDQNDTCIVF